MQTLMQSETGTHTNMRVHVDTHWYMQNKYTYAHIYVQTIHIYACINILPSYVCISVCVRRIEVYECMYVCIMHVYMT